MGEWIVTWFDGTQLKKTYVPFSDIYNLPSAMVTAGVLNMYGVISIERVAVS